jgi:hypothetical protein
MTNPKGTTRYFSDWDDNFVNDFRKAYDEAVKNGDEVYTFKGHEVLTQYAKYVLEYLDQVNARTD